MQTVGLETLKKANLTSMTDWSQTNSASIVVVICLGRDWSAIIKMLSSELEQIRACHKVYMRARMQVLISDAQYLWWDWAFVNRFEKILKKYEELMTKRVKITHNECMNAKNLPYEYSLRRKGYPSPLLHICGCYSAPIKPRRFNTS